MKKTLLLLNGGHSEIPLIRSARKLGYHVVTTGNNPGLIGHSYADEYHQADFSDKNAILSLASRLSIDKICACANDFGALTAAYVAEKLGLPGHDSYDVALTLHHKDLFKRLARDININTPTAQSFDSISKAMTRHYDYPVMVKPVDLTGGKGITRVDHPSALEGAVNDALSLSPARRIVIEPYFEGTLHSFSSFIVNGTVQLYFSDNEYTLSNPYLVSTSAAPALNADQFSSEIITEIEKIAACLNLVDGIVHAQYLANNDSFTLLEITRRCSGDLHPVPVSYALGVDWAELIVRAETGEEGIQLPSQRQSGFFGRHCISAPVNGIVAGIQFDQEIASNVIDAVMWWESSPVITDYRNQRLGVVVLRYESMGEMLEKTRNIEHLIRVQLDVDYPVAA
ncbi:MAG: hypothetical protein KTR32_25990 [Granulosicoccus sp.]|nr:hypothetical protein [Granulosicoccus sp.]